MALGPVGGVASSQCLTTPATMKMLVVRYVAKMTVRTSATMSDSLSQLDAFSPRALDHSLQGAREGLLRFLGLRPSDNDELFPIDLQILL